VLLGIGRGLVGAVLRPVAGALAFVSHTSTGVLHGMGLDDALEAVRPAAVCTATAPDGIPVQHILRLAAAGYAAHSPCSFEWRGEAGVVARGASRLQRGVLVLTSSQLRIASAATGRLLDLDGGRDSAIPLSAVTAVLVRQAVAFPDATPPAAAALGAFSPARPAASGRGVPSDPVVHGASLIEVRVSLQRMHAPSELATEASLVNLDSRSPAQPRPSEARGGAARNPFATPNPDGAGAARARVASRRAVATEARRPAAHAVGEIGVLSDTGVLQLWVPPTLARHLARLLESGEL
jgi:hypothetical protein